MGFDLYGLNPINTTNVQKPIIDWTTNPSKSDQDRYFKEMEVYEKAVPGDYFRNNVWYWRPLWDYICMICDDILTSEETEYGEWNDGRKISEKKAIQIADRIEEYDKLGKIEQQEIYQEDLREKLPDEDCSVCEGTGTRKEWQGWFSEEAWLKHHKTLENDDSIANSGYKWANEMKGCNGCKGTGKVKNWQSYYPFSAENVKEFGNFCRNSGGFEIC